MGKKYIFGILAVFVLISAVIIFSGSEKTSTGNVILDGDTVSDVVEFSAKEIALHNTVDNCWVILHDEVYDVTEFLASGKHKQVIEYCGADITDSFETRPMGSGTPHSDNARAMMEKYYIGNLECGEICNVK